MVNVVQYDELYQGHIWESPVLRYHGIRGNYQYPFLGINFRQFCMILLDKITIKIILIITLFPHNGKLPNFSYKSPHFKISDVLSIFILLPRLPKQCIEFLF